MDNYSLSDLAAITGNNEGFGGGVWLLIILFFLIGFGGNGFGNRNGYLNSDLNTFATASSQNEILLGQKFDAISRQINAIGDGISSLGYNQLQMMDNNTASINGNIVNEGRSLQTQLAECCCSNKEATAQLRFDMANYNAATAAAIHAEGEQTRAMLQQDKIENLQAQVNQLNLAQQMAGVVRYPNGYVYTAGNSPFCSCSGSAF